MQHKRRLELYDRKHKRNKKSERCYVDLLKAQPYYNIYKPIVEESVKETFNITMRNVQKDKSEKITRKVVIEAIRKLMK